MLLLPLPLLLLIPRELFLAWSPTCYCKLAALQRTKVAKHRHVLRLVLNLVFGHFDISPRKAVFRDSCFAECFCAEVCHVFLTLDSAYPQPLGPDLTLHLPVRHICVFQSTNSPPAQNVCGGLRIDGQHGFHRVTKITQQRHHPFQLRRRQRCCVQFCFHAAPCNDLLLACVCCSTRDCRAVSRTHLMTYEFPGSLPFQRNMSSLPRPFPQLNTCSHCLTRFKNLTNLVNVARICCVGFKLV